MSIGELQRSVGVDAAANRLVAALEQASGVRNLRVELWDGRSGGAVKPDASSVITVKSRRALDRLLGALPERGFGRAYAEDLLDIEPLEPFLAGFAKTDFWRIARAVPNLLRATVELGARPDWSPTDRVEARLTGRRHSITRDAEAVRHHYDLPESFYALWLDKSMTYSCAYFDTPNDDIDSAQFAKLDIVCRKLRLKPGERVLDVGCGWGSFPLHAARHYGVHVTGITLSTEQARVAQRRVREEGLESQVDIRLADYRQPLRERFDAVASIGMVEHVGRKPMEEFANAMFKATRPGGRFLLHGITMSPGTKWRRGSFTDAFVFPDGELEDVMWRDSQMGLVGFELRDVESLREHYAMTLERWVDRLNSKWDQAVEIVGEERARIWRLYMTGSMVSFRLGTISIYQSLFVRPNDAGETSLPLRRADWYTAS